MKKVNGVCRQNQVVMIGAILLTASLSTVPVLAESRITSTIEAQPTSKLTAEESQAMSVAAGRILKHVGEARVALEEEKGETALEHIEKGLTLVQIIEHAVPPIKVKADIQSGEFSYHHEEEAHQALIPIYHELDLVDVVRPVARVKKDKSQGSDDQRTESSAFAYTSLEFTSFDLDLPFTKRHLGQAKKALKDKKLDVAGSALLAIQTDGVLFALVEDYLPLRTAANNLKLAEYEFKEDNSQEAKSALDVASDALKAYEKTAGENRSKDVKTLHQEIDDLSGKLDQQQDRDGVVKKMASWWDRVTKWLKS